MNQIKSETPQLSENGIKARFFAQYWGQPVLRFQHIVSISYDINPSKMSADEYSHLLEDGFLKLKPLSKITDEDALKCWKNDSYVASKDDVKIVDRLFLEMTAVNCDYLRSKGYAVQFMDYSVDDLVSFGWLQLE